MLLFSQFAQQLLLTAKKRINEQRYENAGEAVTEYTLSLHIDYDHKRISCEETMVDNPFCCYPYQPPKCKGYKYVCFIPVQGEIDVLSYQPLAAHRVPSYEGKFDIDFDNDCITLEYLVDTMELPDDAEKQASFIQKKIDGDITILRDIEKALLQDIAQYNIRAERELSQYYQEYQKRQTVMAQADQILGIDVVIRPEKQTITNTITNDKPNKKQFPDFSDVNKIIYDDGTAMERDVKGFREQDEAGLRSHFLATLTTHNINASAETINRGGKTDICIERNGQKHIVECKVWNGPETPESTLEQLLDYCTWRERTGTIVIFNRKNRKFCDLLNSITLTLSKYQDYHQLCENAWSFVDTSDGDKLITVYCFDLCDKGYSSKEKNKKTKENRP